MTDLTTDLPLVVPVTVLEEFFQCSICLNHMSETMTTPCGHRYCQKCIAEWVDRNHNCPCCNAALHSSQLVRDHQFDSLIGKVNEEKDKAEAVYFENLINTASETSTDLSNRKFSPVEQVLKKHLKQSLASHEKYFQGLKREFHHRQLKLERDTEKALESLQLGGLNLSQIQVKTAELESSLDSQKENLQKELERCVELIAEAYDRYLVNHIPSLEILPVKVSVYIVEKDLRIPDISVKATDSVACIQTPIEQAFQARGDTLLRWDYAGRVLLLGPLCQCNQCQLMDILADPTAPDNFLDIHRLTWQTKPVLQFGMKPGSEIVLQGCVKCESDMPKVCFVQKYKDVGPHAVDYFSCKKCGFNWICRSCIQICHKGHEVSPYVMNHKPTWACCYCPKKKLCHLFT